MVFCWLTVGGGYRLRGVLQCSSKMQARRLIALVNMDVNNAGLELILKPIWERTYIHMYCMFGLKDTHTVLVVSNGKKIINKKSKGVLSEATMHKCPCRLCVFKRFWVRVRGRRWREAFCQQGGLRNTKTEAGWSGCCSPETLVQRST